MLRRVLAHLGLVSGRDPAPPYSPYGKAAIDQLYNLLFCDVPQQWTGLATTQHAVLVSQSADRDALRVVADDERLDGRLRYLAYRRLARLGSGITPKVLLGVIVETATLEGIDALAAYRGDHVRFLHHTGTPLIFEGVAALAPPVERLFAPVQQLIAGMNRYAHARRPPPAPGNVRLSCLVSDGLYFAEMEPLRIGGVTVVALAKREQPLMPILQRATELLAEVVALARQARSGAGASETFS